jgi:hypothetical protein
VYYTPQKDREWRARSDQVAEQLDRDGRRMLTSLNHAYYRESNARTALSIELGQARKRTRDDEETTTTKRLKKHADDRIWQAKDVALARGYSQEETDILLSVLPDISVSYDQLG